MTMLAEAISLHELRDSNGCGIIDDKKSPIG